MPPEVALRDQPAVSSSGKFVLNIVSDTVNGNEVQTFQVLDRNGNVLYTTTDKFSTRDTTYFLWDSADRIWVYSGDLGTFFWENQGNPGTWQKFVYAEQNVPAPQFLKQMRPRFHPK